MKPLNIGVIGVSGHLLTRILAPISQLEEINLVAIASRDLGKAKAAASQWKIPKAYGSYDLLLQDDDIEAVYIPLPNHLHLEWIMNAADAGKHIICEKPLTLTSEEIVTLIDYLKDKNVQLMEAFMYRFHPKWTMIQDLMKVKGIGDVKSIHTIFSYNNADPKNIRNIKEFGGGALMDIGCYAISSARWIMNAEPKKVMGLVDTSEDFGTDILTSAIMDFGGPRALFTVSTSIYPAQEVNIYGTGGTAKITLPFNDAYDVPATVSVHDALGTRSINFEPVNQYGEMFKAFAKAIRNGDALPVTLEDSYNNMQIINQVIASGKSGEWAKINPK